MQVEQAGLHHLFGAAGLCAMGHQRDGMQMEKQGCAISLVRSAGRLRGKSCGQELQQVSRVATLAPMEEELCNICPLTCARA